MASGQIFTDGNFQGIGTDGLVVANGKLYIYDNSTGLLATTYQDSALTITNTNPVILSASGKAKVFLNTGTYDITLKTSADVEVWTLNDYIADDVYTKSETDSILAARMVGTIAALRATTYSGQTIVTVTGYYTAADNIGTRDYYWDATSTEVDNGGTIIQVTGVTTGRWKMKYSGAVNVKWFGAKGDATGTTLIGNDDTTPIINAIAYANSFTYPKEIFFPDGQYRLTSNIALSVAHSQLRGETHRVILWCDFNGTGLSLSAGGINLYNIDVRRVSGKTGIGIDQNGAPEAYFENIKSFYHTDGWQTKDSHLTTWNKCVISNNTQYGISDLGRSFGSELIGCNVISNRYGIHAKSDWSIIGGAIEQNTDVDVMVGITADYISTYYGKIVATGVHFEAKSLGPTTAQILIGPSVSAGASGRQGFIAKGCYFIGNDSSVNAINSRDAKIFNVENSMFIGYNPASTLMTLSGTNSTVRFGGNFWDGAGTFKSINSSVTDCIDNDNTTDTTYDYNKIHIKHGSSGGELYGIQKLLSAKRSANLELISQRNSLASNSISMKTTGADFSTLYERLTITNGTDIGYIDMPSAYLRFSGKVFSKGGTSAPATGTWAVGDIQWNTAPIAGGFIGWVCTTAGTPGTWKTFGAITA